MRGDNTGSRRDRGVGLFEFLGDVLTAALDKGQFSSALTAIILLAVIWKISATDLGHLLERLLDIAGPTKFCRIWGGDHVLDRMGDSRSAQESVDRPVVCEKVENYRGK